MIPSMMLLGLILGRWWRSALLTATLLWPVLLVARGAVAPTEPLTLLGGAVLGVANAAVGVGVVQGARWVVRAGIWTTRRLRARRGRPAAAM